MYHTNLWSIKHFFYLTEGLHCTCIFRTCVSIPADSYLRFPYMRFPSLRNALFRTCLFRTCVFSAPRKRAVIRVCVCVCVCIQAHFYFQYLAASKNSSLNTLWHCCTVSSCYWGLQFADNDALYLNKVPPRPSDTVEHVGSPTLQVDWYAISMLLWWLEVPRIVLVHFDFAIRRSGSHLVGSCWL